VFEAFRCGVPPELTRGGVWATAAKPTENWMNLMSCKRCDEGEQRK
jgi:hypothetical protein